MDNRTDLNNDTKNTENTEKRTIKRDNIEIDNSVFENSTVFCAAEEKPKKKSRLSPIKKGIISISSLALVTAIVLVVVLFVLPNDKDTVTESSSTLATTEFTVMTVDENKIKSVKVKNQKDSFELISEPTTAEDGTASLKWLAKGYEHIDFSTPEYMVDAVTAVKALKKFNMNDAPTVSSDTSSGENDPYGFNQPYANLDVALTDGSGYNVTVGNVSPDKSGRYIKIDGEGEYASHSSLAYLISTSTIDCVGNALVDCVNIVSAPAFVPNGEDDPYFEEGSLTSFDKILIGGSRHKNTIKVICPSDDLSLLSYMIEEPSEQAANDESINSILTLAAGVYNNGAYCFDYKKSDLKKYGLDKPYVTYYIKAGDRYIDMKISNVNEDGYYAYTISYSTDGGKTVIDNNIIYKLGAEGFEFIELPSEKIYFEKLFVEYVKYVKSMTVTVNGQKPHTFTLDHEKGKESNFTVTTESGKEIDKDEFCYYYARMLYLSALENDETSYNTGNDYTIKFNISYTTEGKADDEIAIYPYKNNVRRYIYKLNGKGTALVSSTLVEDLINCLDPLAKGEKIGNRYAN